MALSDTQKLEIIAEFKTGKYSQRELAKRHSASVGTINSLTKNIDKENEHLVNAQISMITAKAYLPVQELNAILNTANEIVFNQGLVTNATQLNLVRITQHLKENKKLEKINVGDGVQHFEEVGLGSGDYKNIQDAIDKASVTLGVNERHAKSGDVNVNAVAGATAQAGIQIYIPDNKRDGD